MEDQMVKIKQKLKATQDRQKIYADKSRMLRTKYQYSIENPQKKYSMP
jgi:hypothetical protein